MKTLEKLRTELETLVIFRELLKDDMIKKLTKVLEIDALPLNGQIARYAEFVSMLYNETTNLTEYIKDKVLDNENIYILNRVQKKSTDKVIERCVQHELAVLQHLTELTSDTVKSAMDYNGFLPDWKNSNIDLQSLYCERIKQLSTKGYGIYAKYHMFSVEQNDIVPVKTPDIIDLIDLAGYEKQRQEVIDNTEALLKGAPAANALLYGDAGTGKSSTVKAIVNKYYEQGLRLVEITKDEFKTIPHIINKLSKNPLKFILFIDDLSFAEENDQYNALKAVVEGAASTKSDNIVIYATSNRRHLIKESFSDRTGDDIHRSETIQELCSLSDRFGLKVGFFKPTKDQYLDIVFALKEKHDIQMDNEQLAKEAERFALGGRSPRVAKQFINRVKSRE